MENGTVRPPALTDEILWQLGRLSPAVRAALRQLPPVGERSDGPLGPGLLATGIRGTIIRDLKANLDDATHPITLRLAGQLEIGWWDGTGSRTWDM